MPGVSITATNVETGDTYKAETTSEGNYTIQFLKNGRYSVTATNPGFQTVTKNDVTVDYNQTVRTDFTLAVGQVSEHIVVTAAAPPIATDDASVKVAAALAAVLALALAAVASAATPASYRAQVNGICSGAVELRTSNVVDVPNYVVSALLPEAIFSGD